MATQVELKTAELEKMKQEMSKMTDELDLLVAEEEDKVRERNQKLADTIESKKDTALETIQAKIDAIDEDIQTRTALIKADAQRNIDLMIAAAERKKEQLDSKRRATALSFELKVDSAKTVPKTGKILALEKKIRAKEDALLNATALLDFFKKNDKTGDFLKGGSRLRMTVEELKAAAAEDLRDKSKMPNGEPYPDLPWFRDGTGRLGPVGWDEPRQNPGCPYSPTELAYRAAAAAAAAAEQDA